MTPVRFGRFEFHPAAGTLSREGVPVRLQPQPARVLALLVERAGEVVGRDDLRAAVWGDQTFVDFERGLNFCIAQIRSALGDSAESPRYVETLPRRGYRFIAPVSRGESGADLDPSGTAPGLDRGPAGAAPGPDPVARSLPVRVVAGALLVLAFGGVFLTWQYASGSARVRVAVVPFDNETGLTEYDRIAGGVADATVARLASAGRLPGLAVVGNSAALRRPRAFRDLKALGRELDVGYVVLAQVKSDGGRVRLIAHLIRTRDEAHVWAETFDRPAFPLDVQAELAEAIAAAVTDRLRVAAAE